MYLIIINVNIVVNFDLWFVVVVVELIDGKKYCESVIRGEAFSRRVVRFRG